MPPVSSKVIIAVVVGLGMHSWTVCGGSSHTTTAAASANSDSSSTAAFASR